jgi:malate synthase
METFIDRERLSVSEVLANFIESRALPGTGISTEIFWCRSAALFSAFTPQNEALLRKRDALQAKIVGRVDGAGLRLFRQGSDR